MKRSGIVFGFLMACIQSMQAQLPVEVFSGHQKTSVDLLFFRFIQAKQSQPSRWLFFNRNRASADYAALRARQPVQFGFTEAISYHLPGAKGWAPVLVGQLFNQGVYAKTGVQWSVQKKQWTAFGWAVAEINADPNIDLFLLCRYTPALSSTIRLFTQLELLQNIPTVQQRFFSFTQRIRLGLTFQALQIGAGADCLQTGRHSWEAFSNLGGFLRYEF